MRRAALAMQHELHLLADDALLFGRRRLSRAAFRQAHIADLGILVRADEDIGRDLYFFREYEKSEAAFLLKHVCASDTCVDVGANIGFYTLLFARSASAGFVHAFEPVTLNYHVLNINVLMNGFTNVSLNNCAVGDQAGSAELYVTEDGGFASLIDTGRRRVVSREQTRIVTLDHYLLQLGGAKVDVLKVDAEGAELRVIEGAEALLSDRDRKPHLVMLELYEPMLAQFGTSIEEIDRKMQSHGYRSYVAINGELQTFAKRHYNRLYNVFFSC
jgi:FkbM family methyltransferase